MSYFKTKDKKDCCACSACVHSCPVHAIKFERDEEGFDYPIINEDMCIKCGLCERICPVNHPQFCNNRPPEVFASYLKDIDERKKSTSGGIFYEIAMWVLDKGGFVYGAAMDDNHRVAHIEVDNYFDLQTLRGSKYVQSDLGGIFIRIKERLKEGKWCYFTGTGCQVAGLYAFLRKKYETLLTTDVVCHGVPSQWLFDQHISYLENKYNARIEDYHFRNNEKGTGGELFFVVNSRGNRRKIHNPTYNLSPYLYSFMYGMTSRWSCYDCKFAKIPRQGDITLADFWGAKDYFPEIDISKGVSLCLVNSSMGKTVWDSIKNKCEYKASNLQDAAKKNKNLVCSSVPHVNRFNIYKKILKDGYSAVAKKEFRIKHYNKVKFFAYVNQAPSLAALIMALSDIKNRIINLK